MSRAGLVALLGRPNTGKSTLVNAMVGAKVVITSRQPQTTRRVVRGVVNRPSGQLVLVDTPGVHRPRTLLGERLNASTRDVVADVDAIAVTLAADEPSGPGDRFVVRQAGAMRARSVAVVTKTDLVDKDRLAQRLLSAVELGEQCGVQWEHVVPVSALQGSQTELLADLLLELMPSGPPLFAPDQASDDHGHQHLADLIREAALNDLRAELPHSVAVVVDEVAPREGRPSSAPLTDVHATILVERSSQKPIILGPKGAELARIGARARAELQSTLGTQVYLSLHVAVARDWQRDPRRLSDLGF